MTSNCRTARWRCRLLASHLCMRIRLCGRPPPRSPLHLRHVCFQLAPMRLCGLRLHHHRLMMACACVVKHRSRWRWRQHLAQRCRCSMPRRRRRRWRVPKPKHLRRLRETGSSALGRFQQRVRCLRMLVRGRLLNVQQRRRCLATKTCSRAQRQFRMARRAAATRLRRRHLARVYRHVAAQFCRRRCLQKCQAVPFR